VNEVILNDFSLIANIQLLVTKKTLLRASKHFVNGMSICNISLSRFKSHSLMKCMIASSEYVNIRFHVRREQIDIIKGTCSNHFGSV